MNSNCVPFAGCFQPNDFSSRSRRLVFAGLPDDSRSSFRRGSSRAPERIRAAYDGRCYNSCAERGLDLAGQVADLGNVLPGRDWNQTRRRFRDFAAKLFAEGRLPFFAGGDHAVTVPVAEALAALGEPVHIVQYDAHPDLYPEYEGDRHSHACTGARLLEMPHVATLTQVGVRAFTEPQRRLAAAHPDRLRVVEARQAAGQSPLRLGLPTGAKVYVTLDLDVFDPAHAPGVSHPVPGGITPRLVLDWFQSADCRLIGMDAVEVNPDLDQGDRTAVLAGRLLHEGMALAVASSGGTTGHSDSDG